MQLPNLDAGETQYFNRELVHVKSQTYDILKSPIKLMELLPVSTEVDPGAETILYEQWDSVGMAKIIANYADDLPAADVKGKEFTARIRSVGDYYGWSLQELRAQRLSGRPLNARKAAAAVRAMQLEWNRIGFFGDAQFNLQGWLSNPNIPLVSAPADGALGATTFASKTSEQIVRDLNTLVNGIVTRTAGREEPDTLVLPLSVYAAINTRIYASNTNDTILSVFIKNNPVIKQVEWAEEMTAAMLARYGVTAYTGNIAIAYKKSPDKVTLEMPQPFEELDVQVQNLFYKVPCHSRIGGVLIYYPLSMAIMQGI